MKIPRWNWDRQAFDEDEYPDEMFRPFLTWLFTTKAWIEHPDLVNAKVLQLQRAMADYRQPAQTHREAETFVVADAKAEELKATRSANLAKAREARRLKREAAHA